MLRTATNFAFHNNASRDTYTLTIRAVQSNNITGTQTITVNITNTAPTANNIASIVVPSNTQPAPTGRNLTSGLTAVNGSADTSNNGFGLTAALSGSDASSFEIEQLLTDGTFRLNPSTTFNFTSLFGSPNNGVYSSSPALSWSVTDNGGLTSGPIATSISFIGMQVVPVNGWFGSTRTLACAANINSSSSVYYAVKNSATTVPNANALFVGNKVYTNSNLTTTLGSGHLVVENGSGSGIPYVIDNSGVVTSIGAVCNL
tara:strand:+ start:1 stop:777 length:777 start_codon:yes stop_codon:yes gene_type:complete